MPTTKLKPDDIRKAQREEANKAHEAGLKTLLGKSEAQEAQEAREAKALVPSQPPRNGADSRADW
jgi:hypothetical protein